MNACQSCSAPVTASSRFCSSCGSSLEGGAHATSVETLVRTPGRPATGARSSSVRSRHTAAGRLNLSDSLMQARFLPGMVVDERYRIVGLLGKGGMGEVYRADDLTLGQAVALKFLPDVLRGAPARLEMFYEEVRLARQVSHPNVCRVYDVGEVEGQPYLTMEYVDGEDLASLLRRIGRLPQERGVKVARQICAGLAAVHDRGILHRDLKPANVMIDGRGVARLTDFGLAAVAGAVAEDQLRSGTPAYMAPEQIAGQEPTVRSDVYALGLVLYEMFTGESAFEADTMEELARVRRESRPVDPSSRVNNLDPIVETVLLRCLENDPRDRPGSALAVAAAMPGGDPLAAALAAGETPSPEMVAAAGETGALRLRTALLGLAVIVAGLVGMGLTHRGNTLLGLAPARKGPQALEERARQVLSTLGYEKEPGDSAHRISYDVDYLRWIETNDTSLTRWRTLEGGRPAALLYYYRQSPRPLETLSPTRMVRLNDPPHTVSGMSTVILDMEGRLIELLHVPDQVEEPLPGAPPEPDYARLFSLADLDFGAFTPVPSQWLPNVYADARAAWEGSDPALSDRKVRVETAAYRGKPVYFEIVGPWSRPVRMQEFEVERGIKVALAVNVFMVIGVLTGALAMARYNLKLGRGDRRGAFRLTLFTFVVFLGGWLLQAHHARSFTSEWQLVVWGIGIGMYQSGLIWALYIALEPYVRRRWPDSIISWTRLLAGWWRDPRIGRDLLAGAAFGVGMALLDRLRHPLTAALGLPPPSPGVMGVEAMLGGRYVLAGVFGTVIGAVVAGMFFTFVLFLGRFLSRRAWPGVVIFFLMMTLMQTLFTGSGSIPVNLGVAAVGTALLTWLVARFGLLATIACVFSTTAVARVSFDLSTPYATTSVIAILLVILPALFGLSTSLGRRPMALRPSLAD